MSLYINMSSLLLNQHGGLTWDIYHDSRKKYLLQKFMYRKKKYSNFQILSRIHFIYTL